MDGLVRHYDIRTEEFVWITADEKIRILEAEIRHLRRKMEQLNG